LGLTLHLLIATTMSATYFLLARRWRLLMLRPHSCGAVHGAALHVIMNCIVVPLSATAPGSMDPLWRMLTLSVHVLLIGIPIAMASRFALEGKAPAAATHPVQAPSAPRPSHPRAPRAGQISPARSNPAAPRLDRGRMFWL
jgi:hypothetical protein